MEVRRVELDTQVFRVEKVALAWTGTLVTMYLHTLRGVFKTFVFTTALAFLITFNGNSV